MSYILDALRRADSERERGAVPGIHAQPVPPTSEDDVPVGAIAPWMWIVASVTVLVVAVVGWQMMGRDEAPREVLQRAPVPALPAAPIPAAPVALAPPVATPLPLPAPMPPVPVVRASPPPPAKVATVAPRVSVAASEPPSRIYLQSELPDAIRRDLPKLTIGGSIYADVPSSRFLIINGQIFHEGDKLGPELWLEQIKLKAAVLKYRGYRYGIDF